DFEVAERDAISRNLGILSGSKGMDVIATYSAMVTSFRHDAWHELVGLPTGK
ncbi:unnamed protein product, partial [Prorocentrum cordatum]